MNPPEENSNLWSNAEDDEMSRNILLNAKKMFWRILEIAAVLVFVPWRLYVFVCQSKVRYNKKEIFGIET